VGDDEIAVEQIAELAALQGTGADRGHGRGLEAFGQEGQQVRPGTGTCVLGGAARDVGEATRARDETDADLDQADVALHVGDAARAMHQQLAAAAECHAAHRGDGGHLGIAQLEEDALHLGLSGFDRLDAGGGEGGQRRLQIGTDREGLVARPHHQAREARLGLVHRTRQARNHRRADGVHLGLDAGDKHIIEAAATQRPQPDRLVLEYRGTGIAPVFTPLSEHALAEELARMHR